MDDIVELDFGYPEAVEVRNVEINEKMSEETMCFSADILLDGRKVGAVMNRGNGGPNLYHGLGEDDEQRLERLATEWVKANGVEPIEPVDNLIAMLVDQRQEHEEATQRFREGSALVVVYCTGWTAYEENAEPGDLVGGRWSDIWMVGFPPGAEDKIPEFLQDREAEAYRIIRPDDLPGDLHDEEV